MKAMPIRLQRYNTLKRQNHKKIKQQEKTPLHNTEESSMKDTEQRKDFKCYKGKATSYIKRQALYGNTQLSMERLKDKTSWMGVL